MILFQRGEILYIYLHVLMKYFTHKSFQSATYLIVINGDRMNCIIYVIILVRVRIKLCLLRAYCNVIKIDTL